MLARIFCATVVCISLASMTLSATAQTVRFDTNVGTFDMVLNPTGNGNLQGHVDNMLAYVESGRYDLTVINRAVPGFIMQMGGFQAESLGLPPLFSDFPSVPSFDPVIVDSDSDGTVDFDVSELLNTRGTVSLALSNSPNTGTSSFFVNLDANTNLDLASLRFVPFATVTDFATLDLIFGLPQENYPDGGLAGDNVPILDENMLVYVERAFVLETVAATVVEQLDGDSSSLVDDPLPLIIESRASISVVPEPATLLLASLGLMGLAGRRRRDLRQ